MKDRMRDLNIKMTELSEYISVSRPTLYKYIDSYENGDLNSIPDKVTNLFRMMETPGVTKEQVVAFTITTFSSGDSTDVRDGIRKYLLDPSASPSKIELIDKIASTNCLDDLIPYLNGCVDILSKDRIDDNDLHQIARLLVLRSRITKGIPLRDEELDEAKESLRGSHGY